MLDPSLHAGIRPAIFRPGRGVARPPGFRADGGIVKTVASGDTVPPGARRYAGLRARPSSIAITRRRGLALLFFHDGGMQ